MTRPPSAVCKSDDLKASWKSSHHKAKLSPLEHEQSHKLVTAQPVNAETPQGKLQGSALDLEDTRPWPDPVNAGDVLNEVAETFSRFIVLPDGAADTLALWCAHAHAFRAFTCTPRLNICSPEKQCGKTTLRDVLALFVPRPLATENLTVAVLFRLIEKHRPILLADECDAWLHDNEELRGLLNSGYRQGGKAFRCEGEGNEVRGFNVFAPAVLCGIGALPGTLLDRSIIIRLERAKRGEVLARFDSRKTDREKQLCEKLAKFCSESAAQLETCDPILPPNAFNRIADNWRPLFAIAEVAGGNWPERVSAAFGKLTNKEHPDAQGIAIMLLTDIQKILFESGAERIFSKLLVTALCAMTHRPWPEAHHGKPVTETWLARRLLSFGIQPKTLRIEKDRAKGYDAADFADAFDRYLPAEGLPKRDTVTNQVAVDKTDLSNRDTEETCHALKTHETCANIELSRRHGSNPPADGKELADAILL